MSTPKLGIRKKRQIMPTTTGAIMVGIMMIVSTRRRPANSRLSHSAIMSPRTNSTGTTMAMKIAVCAIAS